jgi:hypothetical protein
MEAGSASKLHKLSPFAIEPEPARAKQQRQQDVEAQPAGEVDDTVDELPGAVRTKSILRANSSFSAGGRVVNGEAGDRVKRAVSWQDFQGQDLHTVREFQPRYARACIVAVACIGGRSHS